MNFKKILFTKPGVAELVNYQLEDPQAGEVQVRLTVSTISSGTERANLIGDLSIAWNRPIQEKPKFPRSGGYSSAGIVEKIGEGVTAIKVGDKVALNWSKHSQVININASNVTPIDDISFEDAALFHIATFPLAAIRKCKLEIGESAIVMGMGILGMIAVQLLKAAGAVPIVAVDPSPEKREKALRFGADYAFDPYDSAFAEKVKKVTDGGANVGIEVTGVGAGLNGILDCMAMFGRVALLGCTRHSDFTVDYYRKVHGPGITLIGAHTGARPHFESHHGWFTEKADMLTLKKLTQCSRLKLSDLLDETHSPADATEIYNRLANDSVFPLVQFDWRRL